MEQWIPAFVAMLGSFVSGWAGVRIGQAKLEVRMDRAEKDIDRIGTRAHDAFNAAMSAKGDALRVTDRVQRIEERLDRRDSD